MKRVRSPEEWREVEARGKGWFLLRYGVLGRGLPLALLCAFALEASLGGSFPEALGSLRFLRTLALALAVFSASGCLTANATWNLYARRFGGGGAR